MRAVSHPEAATASTAACTAFLQWALPRLGLRWAGYRKVRGQVCKRLRRRIAALGLDDLDAYRVHLEHDGGEWQVLDGLCHITISRFYRDRGVFDYLRDRLLPAICARLTRAGETRLRCLSLGCCGGEEPYSLALLWRFTLAPRFPDLRPDILAIDADQVSLARAERGCYDAGSLKDLPDAWRAAAFDARDGRYCLRREFRQHVTFAARDVCKGLPAGPFDIVLCRNLAFTYFDAERQRRFAADLAARMRADALLVLGKPERLPANGADFDAVSTHLAIYRRTHEAAVALRPDITASEDAHRLNSTQD